MRNFKLKPVSFNVDDEDEKKLLKEIEDSGFNFAKKTKMMWKEEMEKKGEVKNEND